MHTEHSPSHASDHHHHHGDDHGHTHSHSHLQDSSHHHGDDSHDHHASFDFSEQIQGLLQAQKILGIQLVGLSHSFHQELVTSLQSSFKKSLLIVANKNLLSSHELLHYLKNQNLDSIRYLVIATDEKQQSEKYGMQVQIFQVIPVLDKSSLGLDIHRILLNCLDDIAEIPKKIEQLAKNLFPSI